MRDEGVLIKWNDERGFGFIKSSQGGSEIFVHISAFGRGSTRPTLNERLSFEIGAGANGKKKAVRVMRPAPVRAAESRSTFQVPPPRREPRREPRQGWPLWLVVLLIASVSVAGYGYTVRRVSRVSAAPAPAAVQEPAPAPAPAPEAVQKPLIAIPAAPPMPSYRCDGRRYCSQMTSCDEAKFFLRNCPGVKMDGDGDGIPCEDQLCGH